MKRVFHWGLTAGRPPMIHFFLSLYAFKCLCWIWLTLCLLSCSLCFILSLCTFLQVSFATFWSAVTGFTGLPRVRCLLLLSINLFSLCSSLTPTGRGRQPPTTSLLLVFPPKKDSLFYLLYYLFIVKCLRKKELSYSSSKTWLLWLNHVMGPMTLRVLNWSTIV